MKAEDFQDFKEIVNRDCERRAKPVYSGGLLDELFEDLEDITLDQFIHAAKCHRRSNSGMFALNAANIRKQLGLTNVQDLEWHDVLVMAKAKNTPLAIVASRYVKSYELKFNSDIENKGHCELFLHDLAGHVFRLENGEFTEHELILCAKFGVNPRAGIHTGHDVMPNEGVLSLQIDKAKESRAWFSMIEDNRVKEDETLAINHDGQKRISDELKKLTAHEELTNTFSDVQPKIDYSAAEAEQILKDDLSGDLSGGEG